MKNIFKGLLTLVVIFTTSLTTLIAQTFTTTSYVNNFTGTTVSGGGQSWTQAGTWGTNTISYAQNNEMDMTITQNNWIYAENMFTSSVDISANKILQVSTKLTGYSGKYLLVYLVDASGAISGANLQAIIPLNSTYTNSSIDFGTMISTGFNFAAVKGVRFYIVDNAGGSVISNLTNAHLFFNNITLGSGATNTSTTTVERWTGDAQNINIYNANSGNVSIGTTPAAEPTLSTSYYKFTVKGRTNFIGDANAVEIWSPTTQVNGYRHYMTFGIEKFSNNTEFGVIGVNEYKTAAMTAQPKHLLMQTNSLNGGGNVGIGSFSIAPTAKLSVNSGSNTKAISVVNSSGVDVFKVTNTGKIYATEVKVQLTPFPDYVFDSTYQLMPLDAVEAYINTKGHLPNMPSATDVDSNEIGLGEMTRLQQEKIEELTLYLLQMDERMKQLEEKNKQLEIRILEAEEKKTK